jgi:hypothetical protein
MKATFLFAMFLLVAAAGSGCQDKEMAAPAGPLKDPVRRDEPSTQPAEAATTQPAVAEAPRRVLWWGDPKPGAQGAGSATSPDAAPTSRPAATVAAPTDGQ